MQNSRKRRTGRILRVAYPVAKYAAVLLISLNLYRLPSRAWLLPGVTGPRAVLMLWVALLMFLGLLSDRRVRSARKDERDLLSFLALCDPGLLLLNIAAIAHLYISWYRSASLQPAPSQSVLPLISMAMGCVLWIYGCALPDIPFGSIWGLRTNRTLAGPDAWMEFHRKAMPCFLIAEIGRAHV